MTLCERALAILGFRVLPTTVVVGLTYLVIFVATLVYQEIPFAPSAETTRKAGVGFEDAWADLQVIATFPHPFNSRQNEVVQKHILTRLEAIASSHSGVEVQFDNQTAATYVHTYGAAVAGHFEATNILARINGTQPELDAVLISAHYDSVSTAPGATDDGMGVVTAIALVDYFSRNQPARTLIFNINNAEEDGLWGARIFMEHPWSKLPTTFLNLEGAGAGGRPMLFRASSAAVTKAFRHVARPHGSSLTSDSFALGVVKSGTDFSIYSDAGMEGLDLAFYSRRSLYHTKDDSVPALGGKASLWTMLEASLATVKSLSNNEGTITGGGSPIYVDFLGHFMLVATQTTFFVVNLVLLIVGPIAVLALLFVYSRLGELQRLTKGWVRYPAALLINMVSTFGLAFMLVKLNPNVAYASTYIVLLSLLSVSYLSLYLPLRLAQHWKPVHQPKSTGLLSVYWLSWIFLVVSEVLLNGPGMGGLFFATFLNSMSLLAVLLDFAQSLYVPRSVRVIRSRAIEHQAGEAEAVESEEVTEVTPLLGEGTNGVSAEKETGEDNQPVLWVVQLLALATTNGILMMQAALLVLFALGQTVVDGNSPVPIYFGVAVCAILLFVPIAPFIHKIHHNVAVAVLLLLVISVPYVLLASSFSESAPLKVYFQQTVDLDTGANLVHINSLPGYATRDIIPDLPSARGKNVTCGASEKRGWNLLDCSWSGYEPSVAPGSPDEWLRMSASRLSPGTGRIVIHGANTHSCRIYFDRPISSFRLEGDSQALTTSVKLARLWSRSWNPTFDAVVKWTGGGTLTGRAACGWAEQGQAIPALQEIISFLPSWARVTKLDDGLVEVSKSFKI